MAGGFGCVPIYSVVDFGSKNKEVIAGFLDFKSLPQFKQSANVIGVNLGRGQMKSDGTK